jgi:hypothetical protein
MDWKIETPNNASALKSTLEKLTRDGWKVHSIISRGSGLMATRRFTVAAYRER